MRGDWVDDIIYAQLKTEWGNNDKYSKEEIMIDPELLPCNLMNVSVGLT